MKKRILALIFISSILILMLSGCSLFGKEAIVTPYPTQKQIESTPNETPVDSSLNTPVTSGIPEEKEYTVYIEGTEENVNLNLFSLSFSELGGPDAAIYIDREMYETAYYEGSYIIMPINSGEVSTFMEISYMADTTAIGLAPTVLFKYNPDLEIEYMGEYEIENGTANVVSSTSDSGIYYLAYLVDVDGGTITLVMQIEPEAIEGHCPRLIVSAESILVK